MQAGPGGFQLAVEVVEDGIDLPTTSYERNGTSVLKIKLHNHTDVERRFSKAWLEGVNPDR